MVELPTNDEACEDVAGLTTARSSTRCFALSPGLVEF
jgi:hypothetical protein